MDLCEQWSDPAVLTRIEAGGHAALLYSHIHSRPDAEEQVATIQYHLVQNAHTMQLMRLFLCSPWNTVSWCYAIVEALNTNNVELALAFLRACPIDSLNGFEIEYITHLCRQHNCVEGVAILCA